MDTGPLIKVLLAYLRVKQSSSRQFSRPFEMLHVYMGGASAERISLYYRGGHYMNWT